MNEIIFDHSPCGCFVFEDSGLITHVNFTLCEHLGYSKEEIIGKSVETIFTVATKIFYQTHFFPLLKMSKHVEEIYITLLSKDGRQLPMLLSAKRMEFEGQMLNSCTYITVYNRKKFEDELVAARNAAQRALSENSELIRMKQELQVQADDLQLQMTRIENQNHELQQFSHVITHNLKEPLRKIMIFSQRFKEQRRETDMEKLSRSVGQMRSVVTGLQEYVWLNEKINEFTRVSLHSMVDSAAKRLKSESGIEDFVVLTDQMPEISCDREQLELLFYHILLNSIKFKRFEKAKIEIETTVIKQNRFTTLEGKYDYVDVVRIGIRDDGIGFESDYPDTVFELFRKLHYMDGQGLGLALCKKVVANHGGAISAESVVNNYTKITITLPIDQAGMIDAR